MVHYWVIRIDLLIDASNAMIKSETLISFIGQGSLFKIKYDLCLIRLHGMVSLKGNIFEWTNIDNSD